MGIDMPPNPKPVDGPVEILIVTFLKDMPWLRNCLHGLRKFCRGFQGITVVYPGKDQAEYEPLRSTYGVTLFPFTEHPKGFLHHMVMMALAEQLVPPGTKYVMHVDSDNIWHTPSTPEHYFLDDKPVYLVRTWQSLMRTDPNVPGGKVVSDCHQWFDPTAKQLGFVPEVYTMCRHPTVYPIDFYPAYRAHIALVHGCSYEDYMLSGKSTFPQDRMDFTAMGAFAHARMRERFRWIDVESEPYPLDRQKTYWSRGGITPVIKEEIDGFFARYVPTAEEEERMAQ